MIKAIGSIDNKLAERLLKEFFEPNCLSNKKHMDLMTVISEKLNAE